VVVVCPRRGQTDPGAAVDASSKAGLNHVNDPTRLIHRVTYDVLVNQAGERRGLAAPGHRACAPGLCDARPTTVA